MLQKLIRWHDFDLYKDKLRSNEVYELFELFHSIGCVLLPITFSMMIVFYTTVIIKIIYFIRKTISGIRQECKWNKIFFREIMFLGGNALIVMHIYLGNVFLRPSKCRKKLLILYRGKRQKPNITVLPVRECIYWPLWSYRQFCHIHIYWFKGLFKTYQLVFSIIGKTFPKVR